MLLMLLQILFVLRVVVQGILLRTAKIHDLVVAYLMWGMVAWMMRSFCFYYVHFLPKLRSFL